MTKRIDHVFFALILSLAALACGLYACGPEVPDTPATLEAALDDAPDPVETLTLQVAATEASTEQLGTRINSLADHLGDLALAVYDTSGNGAICCEEARDAGIAPVSRGHPAYRWMDDADGDGTVCE